MRQAAQFDQRDEAELLADYLLAHGIRTHVDAAGEKWALWVREEDQLPQAISEVEAFQTRVDDRKYLEAQRQAEAVRREEARRQREYRDKVVNLRGRFSSAAAPAGRLTVLLIVASVLVTMASNFGRQRAVASYVSISNYVAVDPDDRWPVLPEIARGEIWRLVTPIFLHLSVWHLLFNMLFTYRLGNQIEWRRGMGRYLGIVLTTALASNVAQLIWAGPAFGGMSGVLYGLFGYIWMKSRYEPISGFQIDQQTVVWLMLWLVICMTGYLGPIANAAHVVGLLTGAAIGIAPTAWRKLLKRLGSSSK